MCKPFQKPFPSLCGFWSSDDNVNVVIEFCLGGGEEVNILINGRGQANMFVQTYWQWPQVENSLFFLFLRLWGNPDNMSSSEGRSVWDEDVDNVMVLMRFVIDLCQSLHFPNIQSKLVIVYCRTKKKLLSLCYKTFNQVLFIIIFSCTQYSVRPLRNLYWNMKKVFSNCGKEIFFTRLYSLISLNWRLK